MSIVSALTISNEVEKKNWKVPKFDSVQCLIISLCRRNRICHCCYCDYSEQFVYLYASCFNSSYNQCCFLLKNYIFLFNGHPAFLSRCTRFTYKKVPPSAEL